MKRLTILVPAICFCGISSACINDGEHPLPSLEEIQTNLIQLLLEEKSSEIGNTRDDDHTELKREPLEGEEVAELLALQEPHRNIDVDLGLPELVELPEKPLPGNVISYDQWVKIALDLEPVRTQRSPSFSDINKFSVALIHLSAYEEAIRQLKKQEKLYPNHYHTATNLGTAYELAGKLKRARKWIARGIELNPESHGGTEWLHLAIIDAKIAAKGKVEWFETNSILSGYLDFSDPGSRKRTKDAIMIQLAERLQFVRRPNPVVASLLLELAAIHKVEEREFEFELYYQESLAFADLRVRTIGSILAN